MVSGLNVRSFIVTARFSRYAVHAADNGRHTGPTSVVEAALLLLLHRGEVRRQLACAVLSSYRSPQPSSPPPSRSSWRTGRSALAMAAGRGKDARDLFGKPLDRLLQHLLVQVCDGLPVIEIPHLVDWSTKSGPADRRPHRSSASARHRRRWRGPRLFSGGEERVAVGAALAAVDDTGKRYHRCRRPHGCETSCRCARSPSAGSGRRAASACRRSSGSPVSNQVPPVLHRVRNSARCAFGFFLRLPWAPSTLNGRDQPVGHCWHDGDDARIFGRVSHQRHEHFLLLGERCVGVDEPLLLYGQQNGLGGFCHSTNSLLGATV